jgi:hypothetical protein
MTGAQRRRRVGADQAAMLQNGSSKTPAEQHLQQVLPYGQNLSSFPTSHVKLVFIKIGH